MKATVDPVALGYINRGGPRDYLGSRREQCQNDGRVTTQEGFRTMSSAYIGFGIPFARKSTKGTVGSKADLWIGVEFRKLVFG